MIFLHTTPDPAAPFWLLHFESLTLARLILHPGGPHLLEVLCETPPPDDAFHEFSAALETMGKGFSKGLTLAVHHGKPGDIPVAITLTPLHGTGFATLLSQIEIPGNLLAHTRCAIAWLEPEILHGPVWENPPESMPARRAIIALALRHAELTTGIQLAPHLAFSH